MAGKPKRVEEQADYVRTGVRFPASPPMLAGAMAAQGAVNTEVPGSSPGRAADVVDNVSGIVYHQRVITSKCKLVRQSLATT